MAAALADGAAPSRRSLADGDFWYATAAKLLAPLLFAAANAGLTMDQVVAWVDTQDASDVLVVHPDHGLRRSAQRDAGELVA